MPYCADYGILSLSIQCLLFSSEQHVVQVDPWFVCSMQCLIHVEVVKPFHIGIFWYTSVLNLDNEVITHYRVTMGDVPVHHRG